MRILQICKKFPWPLKDGESIAVNYLARAYKELGCDVDLLAMNTSKHWFNLSTLPADFTHYQQIETVEIDNRIRPIPALLNLFTDKSYHIQRFEHKHFADKITDMLRQKKYDVIQLESIHLASYIPVIRASSSGKIVLRAHNVEHEIWERVAEQSSPLKRWYLEKITPRLKHYEIEKLNEFDLVASISERDGEQFKAFGLHKPLVNCPIGLNAADYVPDERSFEAPLSLSFIGSLDWMPNQDGLKWFLQQIWIPLLLPQFPELSFHIAGRTAPSWIKNLDIERVFFHGEVESAADFLNQHSIMVVPLLSGGGMRAKILEAFAVGKVVLSTPMGMEGIPAVHEQQCLLADKVEAWVNLLHKCYASENFLKKIGKNARTFCVEEFDNVQIAKALLEELRKNPG